MKSSAATALLYKRIQGGSNDTKGHYLLLLVPRCTAVRNMGQNIK